MRTRSRPITIAVVFLALTVSMALPARVAGQLANRRLEIASTANPEKTLSFVTVDRAEDQHPGELSGNIEISTKSDRAISVLTVDLLRSGKTDGIVDFAFVIVRPAEGLEHLSAAGMIKLSSDTPQFDYQFLDCQFAQGERLVIGVNDSPLPPGASRRIRSDRILQFQSTIKVSHRQVADFMFARTYWDTLTLGR